MLESPRKGEDRDERRLACTRWTVKEVVALVGDALGQILGLGFFCIKIPSICICQELLELGGRQMQNLDKA